MIMRAHHAPVEILLVEDNPGDVDLMREAFLGSSIPNRIAVAVLRAEVGTCPDFVVLDLNLPKMDGREVLAEMKADPRLRSIPVVIFSSSEAERDLAQAYQLHANGFVTKSVDLKGFLDAVKSIADFWRANAKLPPRAWGR